MSIKIDTETISDAGFDRFLRRQTSFSGRITTKKRFVDAVNFGAGTIGADGIVNIGTSLFKVDGKKMQMLMNDGTNDVLLIGKES